MNDKKDLGLAIIPMMEWCARYGWIGTEGSVNWELYLGDRVVAYNYSVDDGYIIRYWGTWTFPPWFKVEVKTCHKTWKYFLTKRAYV